ncbi:MAG TPA: hypothetical protein DHU56_10875 [Marinobacter sp.]|nr:hypothetical protein [Marinobacter sp.]
MNQGQINQVKGLVDEFLSIDISQHVATQYGESADLASVSIGEYSAKEYVSQVRKMLAQFNEEIDSVYAKALPFQYHFHNEYGNGNLQQDLTNLLNQVKAKNFPASVTHLNRLIHYQAINGFWEKAKRKYFRASEVSVKEDKDRVDLVSKHMLEVSERLGSLISEIEEQQEQINVFANSKKKEVGEIESLLPTAREHVNEINEVHNRSAALEEKISSILSKSDEKREAVYDLSNEIKELLSELNRLTQDAKEDTEDQKRSHMVLEEKFRSILEFVENKQEYFKERNEYLDDLIGREVGASLFETFKQRKRELVSSIGFWKWSVPITSVLAVLWIFFLFGNGDLSSLSWQAVFVNSLKALPAVGLLLFSVSQYAKERNFQEEYAFKSAVALTVNSYADQLSDESNKDRLIMQSVSQIYRSPVYHKLKSKEGGDLLLPIAGKVLDKAKMSQSQK